MKKISKISGEEFEITEEDLVFYRRLNADTPNITPLERNRLRLSFRNFMTLNWINCHATNEKILSMYSSEYIVYSPSYWWSDKWSAKDYAQKIDSTSKFFPQLNTLMKAVPRLAMVQLNSENCDYANFTINSQNCYLVFGCVGSQDCNYGHIVWESQNCLDCLYAFQSQWCGYCIDIAGCYEVFYSLEAVNCRQSYFLYDCKNCNDCFACYNLRNKQYCFMNKQLTKEEYHKKLAGIFPLTSEKINKLDPWLKDVITNHAFKPSYFGNQTENVLGNHIYNSSNLNECFDVKKSEDCKFIYTGMQLSNCYDMTIAAARAEYCLDSVTLSRCEQVIHSHYCVDGYELSYCDFCINCKNCFGCVGLKNSEYCILNTQYTKEEYLNLKNSIIELMRKNQEYGSFFPPELSPFAYNDSIANEYYPLTKEQALSLGYKWSDKIENNESNNQTYLKCIKTGRAFKIIKKEEDFLKLFNLPLPQICYQQRHIDRMRQRAPRVLVKTNCCSCKIGLQSSYNDKVMCEECYLKYI